MNSVARLVAVVAGLVLMLHSTPSWGQLVNPTVSDGNHNTAGGTSALVNVVTTGSPQGANNTAFGFDALTTNTTGSFNTAIGSEALTANTTGPHNSALGFNALTSNTTGSNNTATGSDALFLNTMGDLNTAIGSEALRSNTTGSSNTATGVGALRFNNGNENTATGVDALQSNTTGGGNTASGFNALFNNTGGNSNTATGIQALFSNDTGKRNTAIGGGALLANTSGSKNTAVGVAALQQSLGNRNIAIGLQAGVTLVNGNNDIYLGNPGAGDESLTMRLGSVQTSTFIAGINTATVSGAPVEVDTVTGQLGITPSSARYKRDIAPMGSRSEKVLQLRPVTFAYKDDAQGMTHYGLIAEEVAAVYPELVTHTAMGEVQAVRYQELIPMLLNELQRQRQELQHQHQELAELRALVGQRRETAASAR